MGGEGRADGESGVCRLSSVPRGTGLDCASGVWGGAAGGVDCCLQRQRQHVPDKSAWHSSSQTAMRLSSRVLMHVTDSSATPCLLSRVFLCVSACLPVVLLCLPPTPHPTHPPTHVPPPPPPTYTYVPCLPCPPSCPLHTHAQWPRKAATVGPGGDALAPSANADTFMEEVLQLNVATYVSGVVWVGVSRGGSTAAQRGNPS